MVSDGLHIIKAVKLDGDKVMLLNAHTATIENVLIYILMTLLGWPTTYRS